MPASKAERDCRFKRTKVCAQRVFHPDAALDLDKAISLSLVECVFKRVLLWSGLFAAGVVVGFEIAWLAGFVRPHAVSVAPADSAAPRGAATITLSAAVDGSERFIFTTNDVRSEHGQWQPPKNVMFNEEPWIDLNQSPAGWAELAAQLDVPRAKIIGRTGRDIITLETTAEGFDVYFADTQMGAGKYAVTISIPHK